MKICASISGAGLLIIILGGPALCEISIMIPLLNNLLCIEAHRRLQGQNAVRFCYKTEMAEVEEQ